MFDWLAAASWSPPSNDASDRIAEVERRLEHRLPGDVAELHRRCSSVSLLDERYRFLAPDAIRPIAELQAGDETDDYAPRTWIAIVDLCDGNYVGVDLVPNADGSHNWLDCDHETLGEGAVIATSLDEFVREALAYPEGLYWLRSGHRPYDRLRYENPPSYWRRVHEAWFGQLGEERGPERCTNKGCERLRIAHSVKCRRHHYEMVHRRSCPFDD